MSIEDDVGYVELAEFKSKALKIPYKDSNISMLSILPHDNDDQKTLERKLQNCNFNEILPETTMEVQVELHKYRIEWDIDLKELLKS